jgi:hypothetical protein
MMNCPNSYARLVVVERGFSQERNVAELQLHIQHALDAIRFLIDILEK